MEIPWRCEKCRSENMIDFEKLSIWPVDKVVSAKGFQCEFCGTMEAVCFTTVSLEEQKKKLLRYSPRHRKFAFLFRKVLKKASGVNRRGETAYGKIRHQNVASA